MTGIRFLRSICNFPFQRMLLTFFAQAGAVVAYASALHDGGHFQQLRCCLWNKPQVSFRSADISGYQWISVVSLRFFWNSSVILQAYTWLHNLPQRDPNGNPFEDWKCKRSAEHLCAYPQALHSHRNTAFLRSPHSLPFWLSSCSHAPAKTNLAVHRIYKYHRTYLGNISHFHLFVLVVRMSWKQMLLLRVCLACPAVRERNAEMLRHRTRLVPIGEKFAPLLSLGAHTIFVLDQAVYCKPLSHWFWQVPPRPNGPTFCSQLGKW